MDVFIEVASNRGCPKRIAVIEWNDDIERFGKALLEANNWNRAAGMERKRERSQELGQIKAHI